MSEPKTWRGSWRGRGSLLGPWHVLKSKEMRESEDLGVFVYDLWGWTGSHKIETIDWISKNLLWNVFGSCLQIGAKYSAQISEPFEHQAVARSPGLSCWFYCLILHSSFFLRVIEFYSQMGVYPRDYVPGFLDQYWWMCFIMCFLVILYINLHFLSLKFSLSLKKVCNIATTNFLLPS